VTLLKPLTSGAKSEGRFGKQDFVYLPEEDVYRCPADERLKYYYTNIENGLASRSFVPGIPPACPSTRSAGSRTRICDRFWRRRVGRPRPTIAFACRLGYPAAAPGRYLRVRRDIRDFMHCNRYGNRELG
jgi:hypothetical protein